MPIISINFCTCGSFVTFCIAISNNCDGEYSVVLVVVLVVDVLDVLDVIVGVGVGTRSGCCCWFDLADDEGNGDDGDGRVVVVDAADDGALVLS